MNMYKGNLAEPLNWQKSISWLVLAVACFHAAYTSIHFPAAGLAIFGYAIGLTRLTQQSSARRAFYWGLAAGFLCYAPQLWFFFKIFSVAAIVLWLVLAFWTGLFGAIVCGGVRRWGMAKAVWLIPVVWTGVEYFRSELYYLRFSWLNVGYAVPQLFSGMGGHALGMYGAGFVVFTVAAAFNVAVMVRRFWWKLALVSVLIAWLLGTFCIRTTSVGNSDFPPASVSIVGVQLEFPQAGIIPKMLDHALAKNTNAQIFVLSEYTLTGPVPDSLKNWCREHARYLVIGGEDPAGTNNYYDTAFVVGTNGDIVFKQGKCVPIQFFHDGLPAPAQKVWNSPWGKIGFCVCYDLSYPFVTDELVRQGAQLLIVPTMDVEYWSRHQHELHTRVAPVRAEEYGIPIFRLASSGISQAVSADGKVVATAPMPGTGATLAANLTLANHPTLPVDRYIAPVCTGATALVLVVLLIQSWRGKSGQPSSDPTN